MDRRQFFQYSFAGIAVTTGGSCATAKRHKVTSKETISSVLSTADGTGLIVVTGRFHYIFNMPSPMLAALKGPFHPYVRAKFSRFYVDMWGATHGTVIL